MKKEKSTLFYRKNLIIPARRAGRKTKFSFLRDSMLIQTWANTVIPGPKRRSWGSVARRGLIPQGRPAGSVAMAPFPITLPQLSALSVEDGTREGVSPFSLIHTRCPGAR